MTHGTRHAARGLALAVALAGAARTSSTSAQPVVPAALPAPDQPLSGGSRGTSLTLLSGLCVPPEGGRLGIPLTGELRYGFDLGPVIVAPSVRIASLFVPGAVGLAGLAGLRLTLPFTALAVYVAGGLGPGYRSAPEQVGLAYQVGSGLTVPLSERLSVGIEASYFQIPSSQFRRLSFGPSLSLGF